MIKCNSKDKFTHQEQPIFLVDWYDGWEDTIGNEIIIDGNEYTIIDIQRNRCSGFFFGSDEEWDHRDLYIKVK